MPMYSYSCPQCGDRSEQIVSFAQRDGLLCAQANCGGALVRAGVELPNVGKPAHQTAVTLSDGTRLKGHFGKDAARRRRRAP